MTRSISEPIRPQMSWVETWRIDDRGVIKSWERGREMRTDSPEIAEAAQRGELPAFGWKGGIEGNPKFKSKSGTMQYLATWQGLRNDDLDVPLDEDVTLVCSRTGVRVTYTWDVVRYANE